MYMYMHFQPFRATTVSVDGATSMPQQARETGYSHLGLPHASWHVPMHILPYYLHVATFACNIISLCAPTVAGN